MTNTRAPAVLIISENDIDKASTVIYWNENWSCFFSTHICTTWNRLKCPCWNHTQQLERPIQIHMIIRKYKFTPSSGNTNSHHHQEIQIHIIIRKCKFTSSSGNTNSHYHQDCQKVLLRMKILRTWWSCWSPRRNSVLCLNNFLLDNLEYIFKY